MKSYPEKKLGDCRSSHAVENAATRNAPESRARPGHLSAKRPADDSRQAEDPCPPRTARLLRIGGATQNRVPAAIPRSRWPGPHRAKPPFIPDWGPFIREDLGWLRGRPCSSLKKFPS